MYERTVAAERIMRFDVTRKLNLCLSAFAACLEVLDRGSRRKGFLRFALNYLFFLPPAPPALLSWCCGVSCVSYPIHPPACALHPKREAKPIIVREIFSFQASPHLVLLLRSPGIPLQPGPIGSKHAKGTIQTLQQRYVAVNFISTLQQNTIEERW